MFCILLDSKLAILPSFHNELRRLASTCEKRTLETIDSSNEEEYFTRVAESHTEVKAVIYFRYLEEYTKPDKIQINHQIYPNIQRLQIIDCLVTSDIAIPNQQDYPYPTLLIDNSHLSEAALSRALGLLPELTLLLRDADWNTLYNQLNVFTLGYTEWFSFGYQIAALAANDIWQKFQALQKEGNLSTNSIRSNEIGEIDKLQPFKAEWPPPPLKELHNLVLREFSPDFTAKSWAETMVSVLKDKSTHADLYQHVMEINRRFLKVEKGLDERTILPIFQQLRDGIIALWPLKDCCYKTCSLIRAEIEQEAEIIEIIDDHIKERIASQLLKGNGLADLRRIGDEFRMMLKGRFRRALFSIGLTSIVGILLAATINLSISSATVGVLAGAGLGLFINRIYEVWKKRQLLAVSKQIEQAILKSWNYLYKEELGNILHNLNSVLERQVKNHLRYASLYTIQSLYDRCLSISSQIERISSLEPNIDSILSDKIRQRIQNQISSLDVSVANLIEQCSNEIFEHIRQSCFAGPDYNKSVTTDHVRIDTIFSEIISMLRQKLDVSIDYDSHEIHDSLMKGSLCLNAVWGENYNPNNQGNRFYLIVPNRAKINPNTLLNFKYNAYHRYNDTLLGVALLPIGDTQA